MPRRHDPDLLRAVGARLAELRRARGLTQEALAEATGLEPLSISRCEVGGRALSLTNLAVVADALGVALGGIVDVERRCPVPERSPEESQRLRMWRGLPDAERDRAQRMMREFART